MTDLNLNCKHKQLIKNNKSEKMNFCKKCGCILLINFKEQEKIKEVQSYSITNTKNIKSLDISPIDTIDRINISLNYEKTRKRLYNKVFLSQRTDMISSLKSYINENNFSSRSFFLGVFIIDHIFSSHPFENFLSNLKIDLFIIGVFLVSVKFIDDDAYPPTLDSFPNKSNPALFYQLSEVRKYEYIILKLMDFKLDFFTSYYLTETMLSHGVVFSSELIRDDINEVKTIKETIKNISRIALDINKMFVYNHEFINYSPIEIAVSCIIMAKELRKITNPWTYELEFLYKIPEKSIINCYNSILK